MKPTTFLAALGLALAFAGSALADDAARQQAAPAVTLGALEISGGFARATLPNAPVGGAYLTIVNSGSTDDTLVAVTTPAAETAQLHEMKMDGEVMKMSELPGGVPVPAGQTVTLQPGGLHIMLMQLTQPLVEGSSIKLTLTFAGAGTVDVEVPVLGVAAKATGAAAPMAGMAHPAGHGGH
jgi:copper(I)-binding protein